jgi:hypothetical protein
MNPENSLFRRILSSLTQPQEIKKPEAGTGNGMRGSLRIGVAALVLLAIHHQIVKHSGEPNNPLVPGVSFSRMTTVLPNSILR